MNNRADDQIDAWLARCADPARDPFDSMAEAGLLALRDSYAAIGRTEAALVARTGRIGIAGVWGGRQLVNRFFIAPHATADQRAAWLGRAASVAISEPGVGAHPKHLRTRAEPDGDDFRITGEKAWVSNAPWAEVIIVFAITSADSDGRKRYSAFLVPRDTPGLSMRDMTGFRALQPSRHSAITLDACRVPRAALLGELGSAYERMALPFRDVEDAVGGFGLAGAFTFLHERLRDAGQSVPEEATFDLGGLVALTAVLRASAESVVSALDAGQLASAMPALIGIRVLAADMLDRARALRDRFGAADAGELDVVLADLEVALSVARGPRQTRQAKLGAAR